MKISVWIPEKRLFPPFKLVSVVEYPAGCAESDAHSHDCFQSVLVISGQFIFTSPAGESLSVEAGQMAVIPGKLMHRWGTRRRCKAIQFISKPMFAEDYADVSALFGTLGNHWCKVSLEPEFFKQNVGKLLAELEEKRPGDALAVHSCLLNLFSEAFRAFCKAGGGNVTEDSSGEDGREAFGRALEYMHANYRKKLSLKEIASNSFLGVSRFSELFRKHSGTSPMKYLAAYRMDRAKTLLSYSHMSVSEVSDYLGFDSIHYFSRAFKKFHGTEPSSLRALRRK